MHILWVLALVTMVLALGFAAWQLTRTRQEQAERGEKPGGIAGPSH